MKEGEIEDGAAPETTTTAEAEPRLRKVTTKVPQAEIHIYRQGKGPIAVFKADLAGWDQDQLEVRELLDKYGFKTVFAFSPENGRGVPIRFNRKNGRSMLTYKDGATVYIDGEPKDSVIKPVTKILIGVAFITIILGVVMKEKPQWFQNFNGIGLNFPPWVLACIIIVFLRMRKRTRDFLNKRGW
uniref:Uncharacterized protein n=1 Tax=Kalanchoe fedtschenkoi TaxID=63787 RepID=A0A7N0VM94_KALFE